jgi:type IV pilus assembly protein PilA
MSKNRSKGFTLIELLVVIAIIGILSAVVLASLSTARNKAQDAKVQSQLKSLQVAAEIYYSTNGNYGTTVSCGTMVADPTSGIAGLMTASAWPNNTAPVCVATLSSGAANAYSFWHALATSGGWCVDSTGASKSLTTAPGDETC